MAIKWKNEDGLARRGIYHSYLVTEGRTVVKFKGDVRDSKYPGKPQYVVVCIPDDESEYFLNMESEDVADEIRGAPKDEWVTVTATGRDTSAAIRIDPMAGPVYNDAPPQHSGPPANLWPDDEPSSALPAISSWVEQPAPIATPGVGNLDDPRVTKAVAMTVQAVHALQGWGITVDPTPIYSTHFIQVSRG